MSGAVPFRIRGLVVPPLLLSLVEEGRWRHPGAAALDRVMPWFEDPLYFLTTTEAIEKESRALSRLAEDDASARVFGLGRGAGGARPIHLPRLDADRALFVAVNERAGDDVAIALDYRTDPADPRIVASDVWTDPARYSWRVVAPALSALVSAFDL